MDQLARRAWRKLPWRKGRSTSWRNEGKGGSVRGQQRFTGSTQGGGAAIKRVKEREPWFRVDVANIPSTKEHAHEVFYIALRRFDPFNSLGFRSFAFSRLQHFAQQRSRRQELPVPARTVDQGVPWPYRETDEVPGAWHRSPRQGRPRQGPLPQQPQHRQGSYRFGNRPQARAYERTYRHSQLRRVVPHLSQTPEGGKPPYRDPQGRRTLPALLSLLSARANRPVLRTRAELVSLHRAHRPQRSDVVVSAITACRHRLPASGQYFGGRGRLATCPAIARRTVAHRLARSVQRPGGANEPDLALSA